MKKSQALEAVSLLKEVLHYIGCACGMSARKPCNQCVLIPKIKDLLDRVEGRKEESPHDDHPAD